MTPLVALFLQASMASGTFTPTSSPPTLGQAFVLHIAQAKGIGHHTPAPVSAVQGTYPALEPLPSSPLCPALHACSIIMQIKITLTSTVEFKSKGLFYLS